MALHLTNSIREISGWPARLLLSSLLITGCVHQQQDNKKADASQIDQLNVEVLIGIAQDKKLPEDQRLMAIKGLERYWKTDLSAHEILVSLSKEAGCIGYMATAVLARQRIEYLDCPEEKVFEQK